MPDHSKEAQAAEEFGIAILYIARETEIATPEDLELASEALREVVTNRKRYEARLKEITDPIRKAEQSARDLFRPVLTALGSAEAALRGKVSRYHEAEQARSRAALEAAAVVAAETGDTAVLARAAAAPPKTEGVRTRTQWKWRIVDEKAIPLEYRCPDTVLIDSIVKREKGNTSIPGVEVYSETGLTVSKTS